MKIQVKKKWCIILLIICISSNYIKAAEEKKCPPGTQKVDTGCTSCSINYHNPSEGGSCSPCPSGTHSNIASSHCEPCGAGTQGRGAGKGCGWCAINHFNPTIGGGECMPCPPGSQSNSSRSDCDNIYDFGIYRKEYLLSSEDGLSGMTKATLSNFRQFFKSLNYDSKINDFSDKIEGLEGKDLKENLKNFLKLIQTEQVSNLLGQRLQPDIMKLFDKAIWRLPKISDKEAKEFLASLKIWGGVSYALEKAVSVVGFAGAISESTLNNIKNKASMEKFTSDFITDSTVFFYSEALATTAAAFLFTGVVEVAAGAIIIGYGIDYLVSDMKVAGKTPEQYYRLMIEDLTRGFGEDKKMLKYIE